jgi:hypothetical protein
MAEVRDFLAQESGAALCVSWRRKHSVSPKTWQYSPCQGQQLPRPPEQNVFTTTSGYGSVTTVHVGHIVHKATAVTRVGWAAQKWFSESSGSGTVVLGHQPISVRRTGGRLRTHFLLQLCGGALRKLVGSLMAIWLGWISSAREV